MKTIKFRAWDKEENEMIYGLNQMVWNWDLARNKPEILFDGEIPITQFTGLKDKNGKEIYEGDVVKIQHPYKNRCWIGEIIFDEYAFNGKDFYMAGFIHFDNPSDLFVEGTDFIEIIGNIYENPELLEK